MSVCISCVTQSRASSSHFVVVLLIATPVSVAQDIGGKGVKGCGIWDSHIGIAFNYIFSSKSQTLPINMSCLHWLEESAE